MELVTEFQECIVRGESWKTKRHNYWRWGCCNFSLSTVDWSLSFPPLIRHTTCGSNHVYLALFVFDWFCSSLIFASKIDQVVHFCFCRLLYWHRPRGKCSKDFWCVTRSWSRLFLASGYPGTGRLVIRARDQFFRISWLMGSLWWTSGSFWWPMSSLLCK